MDIENLDNLIHQFVPNEKHRNVNDLCPQWPARIIIVAPSGGGKTNLVLNLIIKMLLFDRLYVYVKDLEEDKYVFLLGLMQELEEKFNELNETEDELVTFSDKGEDIVDVNDLNPKMQNLVIIDDAILDSKANEKVSELFIRGRKRNSTIIYQTQSYFDMPKIIRLNANYLILLNVNNKRELIEIAKTYACDIDFQEFKKLYEECTSEPWSFMVIDMKTPHKCLKYRMKFDGVYKGNE
jgi:hypothetical protein